MSGEWGRGGIRASQSKFAAPVGAVWRKSVTTVGTRFHPKTEGESTGWKYSRIKAGVKAAALPYTSARSAGSYGSFPGDRKWGQKQKAEIAFGVTFPECLETRARSEGLAGDMHGFSAALTLRFQRGPSEIAYFSDNRSRAPCLLDSHGDMVCR